MAADLVIKNGWVVTPEETFKGGVAISNEKFVAIGADDQLPQGKEEIDAKGKHILPGIIDGHVHFREPGMTHKEDFATGSTAAVCGGVTFVVDMPNTVPPTADAEQVKVKQQLGEQKSLVDFGVTGVVVQTNTKNILPMAAAGAIGFKIFFGETSGTKPHVFHMSSKQAAYMVRDAKARGLRVTAETGPHYLLREPNDMDQVGSLLKMNPPVRTKDHAEVLWDGLRNGYVDMLATDHSPHTLDEKGSDLYGKLTKPAIWDCISGFCGVETGVPLILTEVNKGRLTLNQYVKCASENPAKVWQVYPKKGAIRLGSDGDVTVVDMDKEGTIDVNKLHSKNKPSPWHGWKVKGMPVLTVVRGHVQMRDGEPCGKPIGKALKPL